MVRVGLGIALWIVYGFAPRDVVIILANGISLLLLLGIFYFKWRDRNPAARRQLKNDIVCLRHPLCSRNEILKASEEQGAFGWRWG